MCLKYFKNDGNFFLNISKNILKNTTNIYNIIK